MQCNILVIGDDTVIPTMLSRILCVKTLGNKRIREINPPNNLSRSLNIDIIHTDIDTITINFTRIDHLLVSATDVRCDESTIVLVVCTTFDSTVLLMNYVRNIPDLSLGYVCAVCKNEFTKYFNTIPDKNIINSYWEWLNVDPYLTIVNIIKCRIKNSTGIRPPSPILAERIVKYLTIYVQPINDCITVDNAIELILTYPINKSRRSPVLYHERLQSYIVNTVYGHVQLMFTTDRQQTYDVHVAVCKRHDVATHLTDSTFDPDKLSVLCLLTDRNRCSDPICDCDCNTKWSSYHVNLQRRLRACTTIEIPSKLVRTALCIVMELVSNGSRISFKEFKY